MLKSPVIKELPTKQKERKRMMSLLYYLNNEKCKLMKYAKAQLAEEITFFKEFVFNVVVGYRQL